MTNETEAVAASTEEAALHPLTILSMVVPTMLFIVALFLAGVWLELDSQLLRITIPPVVVAGASVLALILATGQHFISKWGGKNPKMILEFQRWVPLGLTLLLACLYAVCLFGLDEQVFSRTLENEQVQKGLTTPEELTVLGIGVTLGLWAAFGYSGAVLLLRSGPSSAAQRALLTRNRRRRELGKAIGKRLDYIKGDKIQLLWIPMFLMFALSRWVQRVGNEEVCGWILIAIAVYAILVLCFDSLLAFLLGIAASLTTITVMVFDRPELAEENIGAFAALKLVIFDSGITYNPAMVDPIAWLILILSFGSLFLHLVVKRFGTLNGDLCLWSLVGGTETLPDEDFTLGETPEDIVEWLISGLKTIYFRHTKGGASHEMGNVPLADEVFAEISQAKKAD